MKVPFVDLTAQYLSIANEIQSAIQNVIHDNAFIRGKYVNEFEKNFANCCQAEHCLGVGNGTDALFVALKLFGIGSGDDVIVPANSFIATSEAVTLTGARPVFVDCHKDTYNIDPDKIEPNITSKTRAMIPVHLYGLPADMAKIADLAGAYNLKIIQDCAQAHGASINGQPLANFGHILCFSFYPGKNLGAYGDAGAIVTNNEKLYKHALMFANHGRSSKYGHDLEGCNSRMDGIQGAVLGIKLKYLDSWNQKRRSNAILYNRLLTSIPSIITPSHSAKTEHVYHLYVIRHKNRDKLRDHLRSKNIETGIHYPVALPNLRAYRYLGYSKEDFPIASKYQDEVLSLPVYPELSEEMIEEAVSVIYEFCNY